MNKVIMMGRLTKDPEIRVTTEGTSIAQFSLAVDRRFKKDEADFFDYTAFGKLAEFVEKYLTRGTKILVSGRVENNNYIRKDWTKIYGFRFTAEEIEFAGGVSEKKGTAKQALESAGFMSIPDDVSDEGLPFN